MSKIIKGIKNTKFYENLKNNFYKIKDEIITPWPTRGYLEKLQIFRRRPFLWPRWCVVLVIWCVNNIQQKLDLLIYFDLNYIHIFLIFLSIIWNIFWGVQFCRIGIQYAYREEEMWQHKARIHYDRTQLRWVKQIFCILDWLIVEDTNEIIKWKGMGVKMKAQYLKNWKPKLTRIKVKRPYWESNYKRKPLWKKENIFNHFYEMGFLYESRCNAVVFYIDKWGKILFPPYFVDIDFFYEFPELHLVLRDVTPKRKRDFLRDFLMEVPVGFMLFKNLPANYYAIEKAPYWVYQWILVVLLDFLQFFKRFITTLPKKIRRFYWFYIYRWYKIILNWISQTYFKK